MEQQSKEANQLGLQMPLPPGVVGVGAEVGLFPRAWFQALPYSSMNSGHPSLLLHCYIKIFTVWGEGKD